ncbi:PAS domain S-box protein [Litoribacter ruber]|uniref:ATP-binding protein n=1 Tax=Litoribacter ruber TaxID=702568 RepID=UPI001BDB0F42|nr:ATP-binding protein [Litoribacter ruber]MBT0811522.1 PAS domain S-box protein [Litoribacter ruber]
MATQDNSLDYKLLYEMAPCGYILLDQNRRITSLNDTFAEWTGLNKSELEGRPIDEMANPHTASFLKKQYFPLLDSLGSIQKIFVDLTVNDIKLECLIHGRMIRQEDEDRPPQYILTLQNHTESNASKNYLQKEHDKIQEYYDRCKSMVSDYEKALFHEALGVNTKVKQLEYNIDVLHEKALILHEGRHIFHALRNISYSATRTMGDLSDYFHLDPHPTFSKVNLNEISRKIVEDFKKNPNYSDATFRLGRMPLVTGCKKQLQLLLFHLIHNSLTFRSNAVPVIHIIAEPMGEAVKICVIDNGRGIEKKHQKKIFDFLVRIASDNIEGSGIGLAICRRVMEIHSGKIQVDSKYGNGSNFYFTLKRA